MQEKQKACIKVVVLSYIGEILFKRHTCKCVHEFASVFACVCIYMCMPVCVFVCMCM